MMKKILMLLLVTIGMFSLLTACGDTVSESVDASVDGSETIETPEANTDEDIGKEVLRVGMDLTFPPYSYINDAGEAEGFEPLLAKAFAEYLGMEVEIVNTSFSMLIPALETGDVDILIADMSATPERAEKVDFSKPYRYTYTLALVNKEFANEYEITDDMLEADFFAIADAKFIGKAGTKGVYYPQSYGVSVTEVTEIGTGLIEVSNGLSNVLIASNEVHGFHAADPENTIVYSGIQNQTGSNFAVRKGDEQMLEQANAFIDSIYEPNGLYDQIRAEYDEIIGDFLQNSDLGLDYIINPAN